MKRIYLSGKYSDKFALVDDEDFERLSSYRWFYSKNGYARRNNFDGKFHKTIMMHRDVLDYGGNLWIDHINRDKLDNRKENLRIASANQNSYNSPAHKNNRVGIKGVSIKKTGYYVRMSVNGKSVYLGTFKDLVSASRAYDDAAKSEHGEFAILNNL